MSWLLFGAANVRGRGVARNSSTRPHVFNAAPTRGRAALPHAPARPHPSSVAPQVVLTSVTLSVLEQHGVITVDSRRIKNPTVRSIFENALELGGDVVVKAERIAASLSSVSFDEDAHGRDRRRRRGGGGGGWM